MRRALEAMVVLGAVSCLFGASASSAGSSASRVVVRVYPDWRADPKAHVAVTVPLEGHAVKPDAVWREYARNEGDDPAGAPPGTGSNETIIVVTPEDQQDQAVIDAMKGIVFSQFLRQGTLALKPEQVPPAQQRPYLFLDTAGQPLPDANVAVLVAQSGYTSSVERPMVWVADAKLDGESRLLQPPRSSSGVNRFVFYVMHPDCGLSPAMAQFTDDDQPHQVFRVAALPKDRWCVFLDALGRPMAGAWVEVLTSGSWELGRMTSTAPILLDEGGRLRPPPVFTTLTRCSFVVSDLNHHIALVEPYDRTELAIHEPLKICVVPLVAHETPSNSGGICGAVADSDGTAVPGAVVACLKIRTPQGESFGPFWPWPAREGKEVKVLTNDQGQFAMCLPVANRDARLGAPLPSGSWYEVTITPPAEVGCQPWRGSLQAGLEHTITLAGTTTTPKKYEGELAFRDERGLVTDPQKISQVNLVIRPRSGRLSKVAYGYPQGEWLEQSKLPFGVYEAKVDWDGKHYTFRPVLVSEKSPAIIEFQPSKIEPFEKRYRGRVIHGANGSPIAEAVILPADVQGLELTDADALRDLEQRAGRGVRTDLAGRFEIVLPIDRRPGPEHAIVALKTDYLPFRQQRYFIESTSDGRRRSVQEFPVDSKGTVLLPDLKLFSAGTVVVEPNVPQTHRGMRILLDFLAGGDAPSWLVNLWAPPEANSGGNVLCPTELDVGKKQSLRIPAYAKLTLRLSLSDERYAPAFVEDVLVGQGKTADLGRVDFVRAIPVVVKVVDSEGNPVEGVTVTCLVGDSDLPSTEAVTDAEGCACIRVAMHSSGRFLIQRKDPRTKTTAPRETPYRVGGSKDSGREFVLQLSAE